MTQRGRQLKKIKSSHFKAEMFELDLLKMCLDHNLPNYAYDQFMDWAHNAIQIGYDLSLNVPKSQSTVLKNLYFWHNMIGTKPMVKLTIPSENPRISLRVYVYNIKQKIYAVLSNSFFMQDNNLLLPQYPFDPPPCQQQGNYVMWSHLFCIARFTESYGLAPMIYWLLSSWAEMREMLMSNSTVYQQCWRVREGWGRCWRVSGR